MIARSFSRLVDAQGRWARPLGARSQRQLKRWFDGAPGLKDVLNGTWLGHPLHPALTTLPIGMLTVMLVLDVIGQDAAADVALVLALLAAVAAAVTGSADSVDLHGRSRTVTTVHATAMVVAVLILIVSLLLRIVSGDDRGLAVVLGFVGYLVLGLGAYVGGDIAYRLGAGVDRHAWRDPLGPDWRALEIDEVPEGEPTRATVGGQTIVLLRDGETIRALLDTCAHAGGPLSEGKVVDGCIECPWHRSRFDVRNGRVRQGPAVYDQPGFEVRATESGRLEIRELPGT